MATPMVTCDQCSKQLEIKLIERTVQGGLERGFRCPRCRYWYTVALISAAGVRIREEIQAVSNELALRPDDEGLSERLQVLRERMEKEVRGPNE